MSQTCNTCGRPDHSPYRVFDARGRVVQGCIDAIHTGRLTPMSASNDWHNRKSAKAHRAMVAKRLANLSK